MTSTKFVLSPLGDAPNSSPHAITFVGGNPVRLNTPLDLFLDVSVQYRLVQDQQKGSGKLWRVKTVAYWYAIEDKNERELIAYHWHPEAKGTTKLPHLHLESGLNLGQTQFLKKHFPTGRVAFEDVLRCLIVEFQAQPRRTDWDAVLRLSLIHI